MDLILDVNVDVYPLYMEDKFTMALASMLSLDGTEDSTVYDQV